jgi:hypothetical protein
MHPSIIELKRKHKLNRKLLREVEELFSPFLEIAFLSEKETKTVLNLLEPFNSLLPENAVPKNTVADNLEGGKIDIINLITYTIPPKEIIFRKIYNLLICRLRFELNLNKEVINLETKKMWDEFQQLCLNEPFIGGFFFVAKTYRENFYRLLSEKHPNLSDNDVLEIIEEYTTTKLLCSPEFYSK